MSNWLDFRTDRAQFGVVSAMVGGSWVTTQLGINLVGARMTPSWTLVAVLCGALVVVRLVALMIRTKCVSCGTPVARFFVHARNDECLVCTCEARRYPFGTADISGLPRKTCAVCNTVRYKTAMVPHYLPGAEDAAGWVCRVCIAEAKRRRDAWKVERGNKP